MNQKQGAYAIALTIIASLISIWSFIFFSAASKQGQRFGASVSYYEDTLCTAGVRAIASLPDSVFASYRGNYFTKALKHCVYWLKIPLSNIGNGSANTIVEVAYPDINHLEFYLLQGNVVVDSLITGDYRPFSTRKIEFHNFAYAIPSEYRSSGILYIKAYTHKEATILPMMVWKSNDFYDHLLGSNFAWGMFFCFEGMVIVLAFIVWLLLRSDENKWYIGYLFCLSMFLFSLKGFAFQYVYPSYPRLRTIDAPFWVGMLCFFALHFGNTFLDIRSLSKRIYQITRLIAWYLLLLLILLPYFMLREAEVMKAFQTVFLFSSILAGWYLIVPLGVYACIKKPVFKNFFYLFAYSLVNIAFVLSYLTNLAILEASPVAVNITYISAFVEMLLFSSYLTLNTFIVRKETVEIETQLQKQRAQNSKNIIEGEEVERERLSSYITGALVPLISKIDKNIRDVGRISAKRIDLQLVGLANQTIDDTCSFTRQLSHLLSPRVLQDEGLIVAFENMVQHFSVQFPKADVRFRSNIQQRIADHYVELILYRASQEILLEVFNTHPDIVANLMLTQGEKDIFLSFTIKKDMHEIVSEELTARIKDWLLYNDSVFEKRHKQGYGWLVSVTVPL